MTIRQPDGTCIRDYIHVSDLAEAHVGAVEHLLKGGASDVFNVGTGHGHSVKEVVTAVERVTGTPVPDIVGPRRKAILPAWWPIRPGFRLRWAGSQSGRNSSGLLAMRGILRQTGKCWLGVDFSRASIIGIVITDLQQLRFGSVGAGR